MRLRTLTVIAATALLFSGCASAQDPASSKNSSGLTKVTYQTFPASIQEIIVKVADEQGFFAENGLDVELSPGNSGPVMLSTMSAGHIDFIGIPHFTAIQASLSGVELQSVVGLGGGGGQVIFTKNGISAPTDEYPESLKPLDGKRFASFAPGGQTEALYKKFFADGALNKATILNMPGVNEQIAAMDAGQIDVANLDMLSAIKAENKGIGHIYFDMQRTGGPSALVDASTNGVWSSQKFLTENPETAQKFASSIAKGDAWLKNPANRTEVKAYFDAILETESTDGQLDKLLASIQPLVTSTDIEAWKVMVKGAEGINADELMSSVVPRSATELSELESKK